MTPAPILLFGPPSGDCVRVAGLLDRQPGMLAFPELRILGIDTVEEALDLHARSEDRAGDGLLRSIALLCIGGDDDDAVAAAEHWLRRRADWSTGALLLHLLARAAPRIGVLHECQSSLRGDEIEAALTLLPDALLVHVVEPPLDFASRAHMALHGRLFSPPEALSHVGMHPTLAPSLMWYRVHDTLLRLRADYPDRRWRTLRADLARTRPAQTVGALLAELGLPYSETDTPPGPFARPGPRRAPLGDDPDYLRAPLLWPELPPPPPNDPGLGHPDIAALAERLGLPPHLRLSA